MACPPYSLAAALRVVQQCEATSPARNWMLMDRVTVDRATPGMQVLVRMDGIPATDSRGRIAHVRGFYIRAEAVIETPSSTNDEVDAYRLRSIFPSIFLRDFTGHSYFADLDARTILDDQFFVGGSHLQWPALHSGVQSVDLTQTPTQPSVITADAGLAADMGTGVGGVRDCSVYIPLTTDKEHPLRGLVPLAAFQRVSNNAFTIRIATGFSGAPADVSFISLQVTDQINAVTRPGIDIWADIVWLSGLVVDAPWELGEYTLSELSGILLNPDRLSQYAWARYFPEDAAAEAGQLLVQLHDGITISLAGFNIQAGAPIDDIIIGMFLDEMSRRTSSFTRSNAAQSLPLGADGGIRAFPLLPYRQRQAAAAGPVNFRYETRGAQTFTRYVHRTVDCHSGERAKQIEARLQLGACTTVGTDHKGTPTVHINGYEPVVVVSKGKKRRAVRGL